MTVTIDMTYSHKGPEHPEEWWTEMAEPLVRYCHDKGDIDMDADLVALNIQKIIAESRRRTISEIREVVDEVSKTFDHGCTCWEGRILSKLDEMK